MEHPVYSRPTISIRIRLLVLLLALTAAATISIALVAAVVTQTTSRSASDITSQALTQQAGTDLMQLTQSSARVKMISRWKTSAVRPMKSLISPALSWKTLRPARKTAFGKPMTT